MAYDYTVVLRICRGLVPGPHRYHNPLDAQDPYINGELQSALSTHMSHICRYEGLTVDIYLFIQRPESPWAFRKGFCLFVCFVYVLISFWLN